MLNEVEDYIAHGRDAGKTGHGIERWTKSVAFFARNEEEIPGLRTNFKPRIALGRDIALGLIMLAKEKPISRATFSALVGDACQIFHFLDSMEDASRRGVTKNEISFDGGVEDIPGVTWALFMQWLELKFKKNVLSRVYSQCSRVCNAAARRKFGEIPPHFLLSPNPYPQLRGAESKNWDNDDDIADDEFKRLGNALIGQLRIAHKRIIGARGLIPLTARTSPKDGIPNWSSEGRIEKTSFQPDDRSAALAIGQLWSYLEENRELVLTAIVGIDDPAFYDMTANWVTDESLSGRIIKGEDLTRYNIDFCRTILREVHERDVYCSHKEAADLGISYHNLKHQAERLVECGWINCTEINLRKRFYTVNRKTAQGIILYDEVANIIHAPKLSKVEQRKILFNALPTRTELIIALGLFLLRTGWNLSTALEVKPEEWYQPHPIQGVNGAYVELFSIKARASGAYQWAQCSSNKPYTSYDILRRVLAWTEPLRALVRAQIAKLEGDLASPERAISASEKLEIRQELAVLHRLKGRTWLTVLENGRVADLTCKWEDIDDALEADGLKRTNGDPIKFSQAMTRRAFAAFAYEKSGANFVLTKLALGHTDFASLLTYIASQKLKAAQREEWVSLQTTLIDQFRNKGSTAPAVIRELVKSGRLTAEEADRVIEAKYRTRKGAICANPEAPDPAIDPGHREGQICGTQDCFSGCSKSFVTFDTAIFLAEEISCLKLHRDRMDVIAWESSSYREDLDGLERVFNRYAADVQKSALKAAAQRPLRPIFGSPSNSAVRRSRHVAEI